MKKTCFFIGLFFFLSIGLVLAEETLSEAKKLAQDSDKILSELESADQSGNAAKAKALATVYSQTLDKLDQETSRLKSQGQNEDASSIEKTVQEGVSKHQEVLKRVRDQVPEQAHFGIDRALQASSRAHGVKAGGMSNNESFRDNTQENAGNFNPRSGNERENSGGPPSFAQGGPGGGSGHGRR